MDNQSRTQKKSKKKKKIYIWSSVGALFAVLLLALGGYAFSLYADVAKTYNPLKREVSEKREKAASIKKKDPISIALFGVDKRPGDKGRSDTIMIVTLNPEKESMKILSIPRDTRTMIIGKGKEDKINHAYAFGGVEMAINSIENLIDIPIDYYVEVNMEGLQSVVDVLGGITVNNPFAFNYEGKNYPKGKITLNGKYALGYVRMRYDDPRGDFGRQERQRQLIQGIIAKGSNISNVTKLGGLVDALGNNVQTNISIGDMWDIKNNYVSASKNGETMSLKGQGTKINKIYYLLPDKQDLAQKTDLLKQHLEIGTKNTSN